MAKKYKRPAEWRHVRWTHTQVLAFDPALANTGWACVTFHSAFATPVIVARGTFTTAPEDGSTVGILGSLERGDLIYSFTDSLISQFEGVTIVHEVPVNQANATFVRKVEGGPVSAMAVRAAARNNGHVPEPIEVQTWKKCLCNDGHATKEAVAVALGEVFPGLGRSNEHVRDALGCALGWMIKAERWSEHATS